MNKRKLVDDWEIGHPGKNGNSKLIYTIENGQVKVLDGEETQEKKEVNVVGNDLEKLGRLKQLDIIGFNASAEEMFVRYLTEMINKTGEGSMPIDRVIANCAFKLDVSTETIKRYLVKHTADEAEFKIIKKRVALNN